MKKFLHFLFYKPPSYVLVWTYIVANMDKDNLFVDNTKYLSTRFGISARTVKRILEYGQSFTGEFCLSVDTDSTALCVKLVRGKKAKPIKPTKSANSDKIEEIMEYLNSVVQSFGKNGFKSNSKNAIHYINKRIADGYDVQDFKDVMNAKMEWLKDPQMHKYFRPSTLFCGKFEEYLNERVKPIKQTKSDLRNEQFANATKNLTRGNR